MTKKQQYEEGGVGQLIRCITIADTAENITATMQNTTHQPLTCLWLVQQVGEVQDVHPFEGGEYDESTRYYHEEYGGCYPPPTTRGVCYDFISGGMEFQLREHLDTELWVILQGTGLGENVGVRRAVFGQTLDKLCREMHVIKFQDRLAEIDDPEEWAITLQKVYRGIRFGREQS